MELLLLTSASPMYSFCPMLNVWGDPIATQFTPSGEVKALIVLPLRDTFSQ
jgi:hypothetical protein